MLQFVASPVLIANSRAFLFRTGRTPGMPMHTWQVWEFGSEPNFVEQPQNILVSVSIWACTSSPMTASYFMSASIQWSVASLKKSLLTSLCPREGLFPSLKKRGEGRFYENYYVQIKNYSQV